MTQGKRLKIFRSFKGINQYRLGLLAGIFQSRISLIENGLRMPTEVERKKIAEVLGCQVENIWPQRESLNDTGTILAAVGLAKTSGNTGSPTREKREFQNHLDW